MRAVLCQAYGPPSSLVVGEVPDPIAGPGQVRIRVQAAGVNYPDLLMIEGRYQFRPAFPFSPGGEVAGVVEAVGPPPDDARSADAKAASPSPSLKDEPVVGQRVIALIGHGGFAEQVVVDASRVLPWPEGMDAATAGSFLLTYATSQHALCDRAMLRTGETLLVLGAAGGVGLAAVEIGKLLGARVIAAASTDEKLALCRAHGADETINYTKDDLRAALRKLAPGGVDVVYDPVGGPLTETAVRALAWGGRLLVIGFAACQGADQIPRLPLNLVLLKGCQIVGVFWGEFTTREPARHRENVAQLGRWFAQGLLRPHVSLALPLERAAEVLTALAERRVQGKACLLP